MYEGMGGGRPEFSLLRVAADHGFALECLAAAATLAVPGLFS